MKKYNYKKAKELIEKQRNEIKEAVLGMHEDWFWTADSVFENDKFIKDLEDEELTIGGINGSAWATPTLNIVYKNGEEKMIPCYEGESSMEKPGHFSLGVLSEPCQANIKPLENDDKEDN